MMSRRELAAHHAAYIELEEMARRSQDDTTAPFNQGWRRTEHEKHGNRHDRRAERAKQRKLLKRVKWMQARMKADKPGI